MKKITCLVVTIVLVVGVAIFGAWAPRAEAESEEELRYADAQAIATIANEDIYYTSREITMKDTDGGAPFFYPIAGIKNACGAVAGAEIVTFYDKYYENLIENWYPCYSSGDYRLQSSTYIDPIIYELYDLMKINEDGHGVTETNFKAGLSKYFNNHGYSLSYQNAKSGSGLNYNTCVSAVNANKVIVLFTTAGPIYDVSQHSGYDTWIETNITANHIMVAFGYLQVKYYNGSGTVRTETFVRLVTGLDNPVMAYYKINPTNLVSAYVVNVA